MPRRGVRQWAAVLRLGLGAAAVACAPVEDESATRTARVVELRAAAQEARALGDAGGAAALLDQALEIEPRAAEVWTELGGARAAQGDWQGAVQAYETAIETEPRRYEAHLELAILLMQHGVSGRARSEFDEAVQCAPGNARVYWNYGVALVEVGKPEQARPILEEALRLDPTLGGAEAELARVEVRAGNLPAALRHFARADSLGVQSAVFHANWGLALLQAGRPAPAAAELQRAVQLDPSRAAWWNHLGVAELQAGRPAAAESALTAARARAPGDDDIRFNLAQLLVQRGRMADAEAVLRPAPERADLLALRGMALRGLGRASEALECLAAAAAKAPRDPDVLNNYGVLLAETGDVPRALEVWRRVLVLEPANAIARENLEARGAAGTARPEE